MRNKIRHVLSLSVIGTFVLVAASSLGPDQSTNTTVAIKDCMVKPPASGNFRVFIHYNEKSGAPIPNATGTIFITQQQVKPDTTCTFSSFTFTESLFTESDGYFATSGIFFTHDNSEDLWRVEIIIDKTAIFNGCKMVKVVKYPGDNVSFNCTGIRLNEL